MGGREVGLKVPVSFLSGVPLRFGRREISFLPFPFSILGFFSPILVGSWCMHAMRSFDFRLLSRGKDDRETGHERRR